MTLVAAEKGKILCLHITRWPMISLYLLNYRYDSLSQIPTLNLNRSDHGHLTPISTAAQIAGAQCPFVQDI